MHPLQYLFIGMMLLVLAYMALRVVSFVVHQTTLIDRAALWIGTVVKQPVRPQESPDIQAIRQRIFERPVKGSTMAEVEDNDNILSSGDQEPHTTAGIIPVCEPSIPVPKSVDDIINYLADVRLDEEKGYTFGSNKIYELVRGDRNAVLEKVRKRREGHPSPPEEPVEERMIVVRDANGKREIPI